MATEASGERLDEMVRAAQAICQEHFRGIPERSALRGLLNFAQRTPSVAEALLFIRYQAARLEPWQRPFLERLAREAEANWSADVEQLRRFLGILVRAGVVARAAYDAERRRSGPGRRGQRGGGEQARGARSQPEGQ